MRSNSFSKTHNVQNHSNLLLQGTYEHFILNKSEHNNNEKELFNKQPSEAILLNTEIVNIINNEECDDFDHTLLIDSGASHSCLNNRDYFISMQPKYDNNVNEHADAIIFADGSSHQLIKGKGSALIPIKDIKGRWRHLKIKNALFVPSFSRSILSLSQAIDANARFSFDKGNELMYDADGATFKITADKNLYTLNNITLNTVIARSAEAWHCIFGHANYQYICKMPDHMINMRITRGKPQSHCDTCIRAKMTRDINHKLDKRLDTPFAHIYCDIGVLPWTVGEVYKYAIGFIDDNSGYLATYLMKSKSDSPKALKMFLADHTIYGPIKCIRCDQEPVFLSHEFQNILLDRTIKFEMSAPHAHHQNARIERAWRTILGLTRSLMIDSNVPEHLRHFAFIYATYLFNRTYSAPIQMTPFEALTGTKPNALKLQLLGALYTDIDIMNTSINLSLELYQESSWVTIQKALPL